MRFDAELEQVDTFVALDDLVLELYADIRTIIKERG